MDFEYAYTAEQEAFRQEVRSLLEQRVPPERHAPVDPESLDDDTFAYFREVHKEMGARGWLYPTYPKEYGGGGLTADHEMVIDEEMTRRDIPRHFSNGLVLPSILVWGTEEQKKRFLIPLLTGQETCYQTFSESNAGSDLAAITSTAVRDGDDWVINGHKLFITGIREPDLMYGPFVTVPDGARHHNMGYFLIPYPSPGVTLERMTLLNGPGQLFIYFDNVRVPAANLLGGPDEGWQVSATTLEQEHGGRGSAFSPDEDLQELLQYVRETKRRGVPLGADPTVRLAAMDSYIASQVHRLLETRNFWMYVNKKEMTYHGPQSALWRKEFRVRNGAREASIMGPQSLLNHTDDAPMFGGAPEVRQRRNLAWTHPGGTPEIMRLIIARRLGISRTRERAAPTPSTATSHTG
jgi:alkylation response protein AidB-like acyl-CoA dehydrogenase